MNEVVRYELEGPVAWLTIDRPEARNALSAAVREGLFAGLRRFHADGAARGLGLTGAGDKAVWAGGGCKESAQNGLKVPAAWATARATRARGRGGGRGVGGPRCP